MRTIRQSDLSKSARKTLADASDGESVVIEDDYGRPRYQVIPYREPTPEQKRQAWAKLTEFQRRAAASMQRYGVTEDDLMRVILDDD